MSVLKKLLLSVGALFIGPIIIILTTPFYRWDLTAGLITTAVMYGLAMYPVWRKPKKDEPPGRLWLFIRRCWIGEERLWKVFWIVGVGISVVLKGLFYAGTEFNARTIWWIVLFVLAVPVEVWWIVSVWRCAGNMNKKIWSVLSRAFVVIQGSYSAYTFLMVLAYPFGR